MDYPGVETINVAEVFALLGLDPPDTATATVTQPDPPPVVPLLIAGLLGALAGRRRFAGSRRRWPHTARVMKASPPSS